MSTYDQWTTLGLFAMVADESDNNTTAHVRAWDQKQTMLTDQISRLQDLRNQLTAYWNPDESEAAKAFVDRIDAMLQTMAKASTSVAEVRASFVHVTDALRDAKHELAPLQEAYYDKSKAWKSFNKQAFPWLPDDWVPNSPTMPGMDGLILRRYQDSIDEQARAVMDSIDQRVSSATAEPIVIPTLVRYDEGDPLPLPITVSKNGSGAGRNGSTGGGRSYMPPPTFDPPPMSAEAGSRGITNDTADLDDSPILAGTAPSTSNPPILNGPVTPPVMPAAQPVVSPPAILAPQSQANWLSRTYTGQNVLRPGGVIGEPDPRHSQIVRPSFATDGVLGGSAGPTRGANPSAIGGRSLASPPTGVRSGVQPPVTPTGSSAAGRNAQRDSSTTGGGWRDQAYERYSQQRRLRKDDDPENVWEVEQGVAPILDAPQRPTSHDATPGVIGLDR